MRFFENALYVKGGRALRGEVRINTAKNSLLYLILASLLTREPVVLKNVARLSDVLFMLEMMAYFGVKVSWQGRDLHLHAAEVSRCEAPYELVSKMRASFVALGALIGRCGSARMSMPGGCAFGPRPVDRHIKALRQLGVEILEHSGYFYTYRARPLNGRVVFDAPTVGGTQNVILASAVGEGHVIIENAALEPEVADLIGMLRGMGAQIRGEGTPTIEISGVPTLKGTCYQAIPDRIEAGTFMLAAAATRGAITLREVNPGHLRAIIAKLSETGVKVLELDSNTLVVDAAGSLTPTDVTAVEYPGVPTDLQAPFGSFLATIPGVSLVTDRVYPDRFTHVGELSRTGAKLELRERTLVIRGSELQGAQLHATDIRAGSALVVAALAARGESAITGTEFIERGYEDLPARLRALGAEIDLGEAPELATGTYGD